MFAKFGAFWSRATAALPPSFFSYGGFITSLFAQNDAGAQSWNNSLVGVETEANALTSLVGVGQIYDTTRTTWFNHKSSDIQRPAYCYDDDLIYFQGFEANGDGVTTLPSAANTHRVIAWDARSRTTVREFEFTDNDFIGNVVAVTETRYWYGNDFDGVNDIIVAVDKVTGSFIETVNLADFELVTITPYALYPLRDNLLLAYAPGDASAAGYNGGDGSTKIVVISRSSPLDPWVTMDVILPGTWDDINFIYKTAILPRGSKIEHKQDDPKPFQYSFDPATNEVWVSYYNGTSTASNIYAAKFNVVTGAVQTFTTTEWWSVRYINFDRVANKVFMMIDIDDYNECGCLEVLPNGTIIGIHGRYGAVNGGSVSLTTDFTYVWDYFQPMGEYLFATMEGVNNEMGGLFKVGSPDAHPAGMVSMVTWFNYSPPSATANRLFFIPPTRRTTAASAPVYELTPPTTVGKLVLDTPYAVFGPYTLPATSTTNDLTWLEVAYTGRFNVYLKSGDAWNGSAYEGSQNVTMYLFTADGRFVTASTPAGALTFSPAGTPPGKYYVLLQPYYIVDFSYAVNLYPQLKGFTDKAVPSSGKTPIYLISRLM